MRAEPLIVETLLLEETRFKPMLERGLGLLAEETARLGDGQALPGAVAFRLYDTFGFPLDLTQDALREQGRGVDLAGFEAAMAEQRARARAAWAGSGEAATERVWFELKEQIGATEFLGYSTETRRGRDSRPGGRTARRCDTRRRRQRRRRGAEPDAVLRRKRRPGRRYRGDHRRRRAADPVTDTQQKLGDLFVHLGRVEAGEAQVGTPVVAEVDHVRRTAIRAHHSATHLLHEALRRRLGTHVTQKGSLNAPDRLRFDISQPRPITARRTAPGWKPR